MSVLALFVAALVSAGAPQPLWVELGAKNAEHGLTVLNQGDGVNEAVTIGGVEGRQTAAGRTSYLYVKADATQVPAGRYDAYATVDFLDGAPGVFPVEYDALAAKSDASNPYTAAQDCIVRFGSPGTGQWRRAIIHLPDARFGHGENWGADFRICGAGLVVRRVEVSFVKPDDYVEGGVRVPEHPVERAGPGMEVTFGSLEVGFPEAALARSLGARSYETYVTWRSVENAGEGRWDWSRWDKQVEILHRAGLKWVPIIIAGPGYATPDWFRESSRSVPYVCLEHGQAGKIQSLWNPEMRGWWDRLLKAFAEHYKGSRDIESVMLGISGSFGETLYPGGPADTGWIYDAPGVFHNHIGWWAGDRFAVADFRRVMGKRYGDIAALNRAWGTKLASFEEVAPFLPDKAPSLRARLDMVTWYIDSMTEWATFCGTTARKYMPDNEIYMCVGGFGEPVLGADFTAIARNMAPLHEGLRITNEGSNYPFNLAVTREVATACRALGEPIGFEPGGDVNAEGNVARIYNDTASGAKALFCYTFNVEQSEQAMTLFDEALPWLQARRPIVPAGIFLPKTSWRLNDLGNPLTLGATGTLRGRVDVQMVDANLLGAAPPKDLRVLAVCDAPYAEPGEVAALKRWVEGGGIVVALEDPEQPLLRAPEGNDAGTSGLLASPPAKAQPLRVTIDGPSPRHFRLEIGKSPDDDYLVGDWNGPEPGGIFPAVKGATQRWSGARSGLLLPCDPSADATLAMDAHLDPHSLPGDNQVLVNGTAVGVLDKVGPHRYSFPVPRALFAGAKVAEVTFAVRPFKPSDSGGDDNRTLGTCVADVELWVDGAEDQPAVTTPLRWDVDWAAAAACVRRIGKGATLVLPGRHHAGLAEAMVEVLAHPERLVPGAKAIPVPPQPPGVYATQTAEGVLTYGGGKITFQPAK